MPAPAEHQIVAADVHVVPPPFHAFAVRSDEACHAFDARAPYGRVHLVRTAFLDAASLSGLAAAARARVEAVAFPDINHAITTLAELAAAASRVADLAGSLAAALQSTGVLGPGAGAYRHSLATRIDFLAANGAGFHNDAGRHWSRCLFWVLALRVADVEFVMPHAGVRLLLEPGDLLVFDPALAHGLCRPRDGGQAVAASFAGGEPQHQYFLTGELLLTDAHWAALGAPWLAVEEHERRGALDLTVAAFDERSGLVQRPHALRDGMKRSTCHVDGDLSRAAGTTPG
ncbi:MAG: hypothetical protein Q7U73_14450 [Rubrivivax sp.]|nr:hypothetical protein [Rubrivivax sp.]